MNMRLRTACAVILPFALFAREPFHARHAMVTGQEPIATRVGVARLAKGGNAVDAAVAVGFARAVTFPFAGNLGGGGFMLIRMADGRSTFIDFREMAPHSASRNMYLDSNGHLTKGSLVGWRASGVPGSVAGFALAMEKYGAKKWADVVAPAQKLAQRGIPVSYALAESLRRAQALLSQFPDSKRIFLNNGTLREPGTVFKQPELARTLKRIRSHGAKEFYHGQTARLIDAAMRANGGDITLDDLANYRAVERKPLTGSYRGYSALYRGRFDL